MIDADHFLIDRKEAWAVAERVRDVTGSFVPPVRPCDCTLGRSGTMSDCDGTGRHTFEIEVARTPGSHGMGIGTLRVHALEVLSLYGDEDWLLDDPSLPRIARAPSVDDQWYLRALDEDGFRYAERVILPPAAAVGMWAVRLAVHS